MKHKTIKLSSIATGLFMTAALAHADQCQLVPIEQASRALNHLKPGSTFVKFCEPCGDKDFYKQPQQVVNKMYLDQAVVSDVTYWEISLNGKGIDMAYTFVRTADGSYLNLSKLADCPSQGVSAGFAAPEG